MGKLMHKTTSKSTHISVFEFPAEEPHVTFTDILIILISLTHFKYFFFFCVCVRCFSSGFFFFFICTDLTLMCCGTNFNYTYVCGFI